jgi:hypothetical protein
LQAAYVGSRSLKLTSVRPLNFADPALNRRPVPTIGDINFMENAGTISYHAVQLSANQRLVKGFSADLYYTFSKALTYYVADDTITFTLSGLQDPLNIANSYGPKPGDVRHRYTGIFSYQTPKVSENPFLRAIAGGWTIQSITAWRSGIPINITAGRLLFQNGRLAGQRPDALPGADPYRRNIGALTWLNAAAFDVNTPAAQRRYGNLGFNTLRGPSGFSMDAAIHKQFVIREGHRLQFRFEMFNALNHKILGSPVSDLANPNFGLITGATGGRNIQMALKYAF